jgi:hypothetical protein
MRCKHETWLRDRPILLPYLPLPARIRLASEKVLPPQVRGDDP